MTLVNQTNKILENRPVVKEGVSFFSGRDILLSIKDIDLVSIASNFSLEPKNLEKLLDLDHSLKKTPIAYHYGKMIALNKKDYDIMILDQNESFQKIVGNISRTTTGKNYSQIFGSNRYTCFIINKIAEVAYGKKFISKKAFVNINRKLYEIYLYSPLKGYFVSFLTEVKDMEGGLSIGIDSNAFRTMFFECRQKKAIILSIRLPFRGLKSITMISSYEIAEEIGLEKRNRVYSDVLLVSRLIELETKQKSIKNNKKLKVYTVIDI